MMDFDDLQFEMPVNVTKTKGTKVSSRIESLISEYRRTSA